MSVAEVMKPQSLQPYFSGSLPKPLAYEVRFEKAGTVSMTVRSASASRDSPISTGPPRKRRGGTTRSESVRWSEELAYVIGEGGEGGDGVGAVHLR